MVAFGSQTGGGTRSSEAPVAMGVVLALVPQPFQATIHRALDLRLQFGVIDRRGGGLRRDDERQAQDQGPDRQSSEGRHEGNSFSKSRGQTGETGRSRD